MENLIEVGDNFSVLGESGIKKCILIHGDYIVSSELDLSEPISPGYLMYKKSNCKKVN